MIITYSRSSSISRNHFCEHAYFGEYVLGYRGDSNKRAEMGNIFHKCLELLALIKKARQDGVSTINEEGIGEINVDTFSIDDLFSSACNYYVPSSVHTYTQKEITECRMWLTKALEAKGGLYNPLNLEIYDAEKSFDITFDDDWARYEYEVKGKKLQGQFSIKGNVDLITKYSDNVLEFTDYKTGKCMDWGTGKEYTYNDLAKSYQLLSYYYALAHIYPKFDILINIWYLNYGGLFSFAVQRSELPKIKERIRVEFEQIKNNEKPKLLSPDRKKFQCYRLCYLGKNNMPGTDITICEHLQKEVKKKGMKQATEDNMLETYDISAYGSGGGREGLKE